jgi:hypothetical protein
MDEWMDIVEIGNFYWCVFLGLILSFVFFYSKSHYKEEQQQEEEMRAKIFSIDKRELKKNK